MATKYLDDAGLARYDTKIKGYIADAVGTKKYRHNIFATWAGGSGSDHVHGCLSFNFVDTSSTPYGNNGSSPVFNADTFRTFIKEHMGFTPRKYNYYSAVGGYAIGLPVTTTGTIVAIEYDSSSSWYMFVIGENQYGKYFSESYFTVFPNISGNYVFIYDRVEEL